MLTPSLASLVLCLGLGAEPSSTAAHTYYVDAVRGNDVRDGLSPDAAWRSLDRVNKAVLQPGERVLFRRGQTWRGQIKAQSGSPAGAVLYGAYGDGDKPLLLGSVAMDRADDWQPAGPGLWATAPVRFTRRGSAPTWTKPPGRCTTKAARRAR